MRNSSSTSTVAAPCHHEVIGDAHREPWEGDCRADARRRFATEWPSMLCLVSEYAGRAGVEQTTVLWDIVLSKLLDAGSV
jgi:hypothetical protein